MSAIDITRRVSAAATCSVCKSRLTKPRFRVVNVTRIAWTHYCPGCHVYRTQWEDLSVHLARAKL